MFSAAIVRLKQKWYKAKNFDTFINLLSKEWDIKFIDAQVIHIYLCLISYIKNPGTSKENLY